MNLVGSYLSNYNWLKVFILHHLVTTKTKSLNTLFIGLFEMISQEIINRGGSKLEITRAIIEGGLSLDIPVPNSVWLYDSDARDPRVVAEAVKELHSTLIVRGSHPNDYHGYIDVIPTHRNVRDRSQLEEAVQDILVKTASDDTRKHATDWGQPFSPQVHLLIQEQSPSTIIGSMIRHPHDKKQLRIQYADLKRRHGDFRDIYSFANTDKRGELIHEPQMTGIIDAEILQLIAMYERLEKSGILDPKWSYQVEFGLRPLMFFQARPFKKFQRGGKFDVPETYGQTYPYMTFDDAFGITPPDGLPVTFHPASWEHFSCDDMVLQPIQKGERYSLILVSKLSESPETRFNLGNLVAFVSPCESWDYLYHGNYRFMKKADHSCIRIWLRNIEKEG